MPEKVELLSGTVASPALTSSTGWKLSPGFLKNIQRLHACFGLVTTNRERTVSGCLVEHIQWFHANEC